MRGMTRDECLIYLNDNPWITFERVVDGERSGTFWTNKIINEIMSGMAQLGYTLLIYQESPMYHILYTIFNGIAVDAPDTLFQRKGLLSETASFLSGVFSPARGKTNDYNMLSHVEQIFQQKRNNAINDETEVPTILAAELKEARPTTLMPGLVTRMVGEANASTGYKIEGVLLDRVPDNDRVAG